MNHCMICDHKWMSPATHCPECGVDVTSHKHFLLAVEKEVARASAMWPTFNSAHEGFAILCEEVDELKAHVWMNQKNRDVIAMKKEAIQVAAMAVRFAHDVCNEERGRK